MRSRTAAEIAVLCILLAAAFCISCCTGSANISVKDVCLSVFTSVEGPSYYIIRNIRIPRVVGAMLCGALLSLCGVIYQSVFRNPMADPYLLGVSSGASFSVALGALVGITAQTVINVPVWAFFGAVTASMLSLLIARSRQNILILSGIALSGLFSACTTLLIYLNKHELTNIVFWNMGSFSSMNKSKAIIMTAALAIVFVLTMLNTGTLDILLLDDASSRSLGVDTGKARLLLTVIATLATAAAVCFCGVIGFAGLLAPHIARLLTGPKHSRLVPVATLCGALIMLIADTLARTVLKTGELPVGVVTAILGSPLFLILALRKENRLW